MRLAALIFALALLPSTLAAPEGDPLIHGRLSHLDVVSGAAETQGGLKALQLSGNPSDPAPGPFRVTEASGNAQLVTRHAEGYGVASTRVWYTTRSVPFTDATLEGLEKRAGHSLTVYASETQTASIRHHGSDLQVAATEMTSIPLNRISASSPLQPETSSIPASIRVAPALGWTTAGLEVSGTYTLSLYEWDLALTTAEGRTEVRTGVDVSARFGLPHDAVAWSQEETQAIIELRSGTFDLPAQAGSDAPVILVSDSLASIAGSVRLADVLAQTTDGQRVQPLVADTVTIDGDLQILLSAPQDGKIPFTVGAKGRPVLAADGTTLAWAAPEDSMPPWVRPAATVALLALMIGVALAGRRATHLRQDRRLEQAEVYLENNSFQAAIDEAAPLLHNKRHGAEAAVIQADAMIGSGRPRAALDLMQSPRFHGPPAMRDFLSARAHALMGDLDLAQAVLARCLALAPDLLTAARNDTVLAALSPPEGYT